MRHCEPFIYSQRGGGGRQARPAKSKQRASASEPGGEPLSEPLAAPTSHSHPLTTHSSHPPAHPSIRPPAFFLATAYPPATDHHHPHDERKDSKGDMGCQPSPASPPLSTSVTQAVPVTSHRWADVRTEPHKRSLGPWSSLPCAPWGPPPPLDPGRERRVLVHHAPFPNRREYEIPLFAASLGRRCVDRASEASETQGQSPHGRQRDPGHAVRGMGAASTVHAARAGGRGRRRERGRGTHCSDQKRGDCGWVW